MRKLALALSLSLLALTGIAVPAERVAAALPSDAKVVIIVGAVHGATDTYRNRGDAAYREAIKHTSNVVRVYSPNATWAAVKSAVAGAAIVIYMGHGNGWPSPYTYDPAYTTKNGFGLNREANNGDHNNRYYGEPSIEALDLQGAVVLLNHLCYASGNSEPGHAEPSWNVAKQRVDNYGSAFLRAGAAAVVSDGHSGPEHYIRSLFTTNQTIDQIWQNAPNRNGHVQSFESARTAGATYRMDPDGTSSGFYRSIVGRFTAPAVDCVPVPAPASEPAGATFTALPPARVLDTRSGIGLSGRFANGSPRTFEVAGRGGVPVGAVAVTGIVTVVGQTEAGYVSLTPEPTATPGTSTLNFPRGDVRANGVTVSLSGTGTLAAVYRAGPGDTTDLVLDITGYFVAGTDGARFTGLAPARLLDSRNGNGVGDAFTSDAPRTFQVAGRGGVPNDATAVTGNLTVTGQTGAGYVSLTPEPTASPATSSLNFPSGDTRANGLTVALGSGGTLAAVYKSAPGRTAELVFDVTCYFRPGTAGLVFVPIEPTRVLDTRVGNGLAGSLTSGAARELAVADRCGVPAAAAAVIANATVTGPTAAGYVSVTTAPTDTPGTSTLNFPKGDTRANGLAILLDTGTLGTTYRSATGHRTHLILDVTGYFR